jgi:hypothetical protein
LQAIEPRKIVKYLGGSAPSGDLTAAALARLTPADFTQLHPSMLTEALTHNPPVEVTVPCLLVARQMTADRARAAVAVLAYEQTLVSLRPGKRRGAIVKALALERDTSGKQVVETLARQLNHDLRHGNWPSADTFKLTDREAFHTLMNGDRAGSLPREALLESRTRKPS